MPRIDPAHDADEPGGAATATPDPTPVDDVPVPPAPVERPRRKHRKLVAGLLISVSILLVLGAVGVGGYPYYTDIQARRHQKDLNATFNKERQATGDQRTALIQQYENRSFASGEGITKIIIPAISINEIVVEGTTDAALNVGAGHYPMTPLPGQVGNVAIAGHRTMNGHPFGDLNKLAPGDTVILQTPFDSYTYQLLPAFDGHSNPWVVSPDDWSVIEFATTQSLLTLTTCNPPGQQTTRLVARAQLVSSTPA